MNYTQSITRRHRTAFVLAIDQSGSMVEELEFRGRRTSKAAAVAEVANSLLSELLLRATREGEVRDYYDIAVVGYSGEGVHSLLSADETFVPVSALRNAVRNTRRVSIERRLPDGQPAFNEVTVSEWIAPAASGQTPMYEALLYVHDLVEAWCRRPEHRESFPPLVFNNRYARLLYDISSPMPPLFDDAIRSLRGDEARGPFRGMCYNASITELLSILNVGSISVNLQ